MAETLAQEGEAWLVRVFYFIYLFIFWKRNVRYLFKKSQIILFKYCADVENCESFRGFSYIYIYIYKRELINKNTQK